LKRINLTITFVLVAAIALAGQQVHMTASTKCNLPYKPFPIVSNDPDFLDKQFDEVYLRVREALCLFDSSDTRCLIHVDTLFPCSRDTLNLIYKAVVIKDTSHDDIGSAILLYEDITDSLATPPGQKGPEYAGFVVNRGNHDGALDTNQIDTSYILVLPKDDGNVEDRTNPGGTGYSAGAAHGNSELLTDATGNLYWLDRDWFPRVMVDTIIADTSQAAGSIVVEAEDVYLKSDTARVIDGKWGGSQLDIHWYESVTNGTKFVTLRVAADILGTWDFIFPDTSASSEPSQWRFPKSANEAPTFVPFDDQYIVWGIDTVSCKTSTKTISIGSGRWPASRSPQPGKDMPFKTLRSFYVEVDWVVVDPDSAAVGDFFVWRSGDKPCGRPAPGEARLDSLFVMSLFDEDFKSQNENGDPRYDTDSTFVVHVPQIGCDSIWVIRWKATGWLAKYLGEG